MIFIAGIIDKVKDIGNANGACPICRKNNILHVNKKYSIVTLFFIPTIHFAAEYFAICTHCSSVFILEKQKGKKVEKGIYGEILEQDLKIFQNNYNNTHSNSYKDERTYKSDEKYTCPECGQLVDKSSNFCQNCGKKF